MKLLLLKIILQELVSLNVTKCSGKYRFYITDINAQDNVCNLIIR